MLNKQKIQILVWITIACIIAVLFFLSGIANGETILPENYYVWSSSIATSVSIPDGYVPTEISIRICGITNISENPFSTLYVHLLSHYNQQGWISNIDDQTGDIFDYLSWQSAKVHLPGSSPTDPSLEDPRILAYNDLTPGKEDILINLSSINNPDSWAWKVFKYPFDFRLSNGRIQPMSSALLQCIDTLGSEQLLAIGLDPDGTDAFSFDNISIEITIETYAIAYDKKTILIEYAPTPYTLSVSSNNGSITKVPDKSTYNLNDIVTLTATPYVGYIFGQWTGDITGSINPVSITITGNKSIIATFIPIQYNIAITNNPLTGGSVSKNPEKSTYIYGDEVTLTAIPADGYYFYGWSGNLSGSANPTTITITGNQSITAIFFSLGNKPPFIIF